MSATIQKAKKVKPDELSRDPEVRKTLKMVEENPSGVAVLEIALMECALSALDEVYQDAKKPKVKPKAKGDVKKFYRALAKTGISDPERAIEVLKHLGGEDGDEDHPSGTSQDVHSGGGDKEAKPKRKGEKQADDFDDAAKKIFETIDNPKIKGAVRSFLSETGIGQGVVATAKFFADTGGKFQFAAKAIAEFGPIAGVRVAHTYFRYGGYDVPMKGGKTEMGDKLPTEGGVKAAREWAISRLSKRLPTEQANNAGAEPPSEGFLIGKDGTIIAHAVGRGNDHFLPFNSRHLRKLRQTGGGEYVRRRMFGGPTTEDLHAAMMMGASKVTVVSNGGTFSIDLTDRSHGLKLEHMQVLSRYQEILDARKGRLNFDGYDSALDSLVAEFPLHFRKVGADPGKWAGTHDRLGPKDKLTDQIKNLFGILGGDESSSRQPSGGGIIRDEGGRVKIPGQHTGESVSQSIRRQMNGASPQKRQQLLQQAEAYYRAQGTDPSSVNLVRDLRRSVHRMRESESVKTPSTAGENWGQVDTRVDPTVQTARAVQPPGDTSYINAKGMNRIRDLFEGSGLDTKNPDPRQVERLKEIATAAANDRAYESLLEQDDIFRELQGMFPNIA